MVERQVQAAESQGRKPAPRTGAATCPQRESFGSCPFQCADAGSQNVKGELCVLVQWPFRTSFSRRYFWFPGTSRTAKDIGNQRAPTNDSFPPQEQGV